MRRSSSKKKSQRSAAAAAAAAAAGTICELDDSALERHVGIVEDDVAIDESPSALPSAEVCENASLRQLFYFPLLCGWGKVSVPPTPTSSAIDGRGENFYFFLSLSPPFSQMLVGKLSSVFCFLSGGSITRMG